MKAVLEVTTRKRETSTGLDNNLQINISVRSTEDYSATVKLSTTAMAEKTLGRGRRSS